MYLQDYVKAKKVVAGFLDDLGLDYKGDDRVRIKFSKVNAVRV
jgi:hypothetical protein